jgi:hypothetical protein
VHRMKLAAIISASVAGGFVIGALLNNQPARAQSKSYKVVVSAKLHGRDAQAGGLEHELNLFASQGWRLHSTFSDSDPGVPATRGSLLFLIFERK